MNEALLTESEQAETIETPQNQGFLQKLLLAFVAGGATVMAHTPFNFWPVLFVGLSALLALSFFNTTKKQAFAIHYVFGLGYFMFGLSWIGNALLVEGSTYKWAYPLALIGIPAGMSLFFGLAGLSHFALFKGKKNLQSYLGFIAVYSIAEWLRGHIFTGFPWLLFGYGWNGSLCMLQNLSYLGVYALTAMTFFWCAAPAYWILSTERQKRRVFIGAIAFLTLFSAYTYGTKRLIYNAPQSNEDVIVKVIQPNIAQKNKWNKDKLLDNFKKSVELTAPDIKVNKNLTYYVIWPETSILQSILDIPESRKALSSALKLHGKDSFLLAGMLVTRTKDETDFEAFNTLSLFDNEMNVMSRYNKSHLVPFGEYMPFQSIIPIAPIAAFKGFTAGTGPQAVPIPPFRHELSYSAMICYEIIFPGHIIDKDTDRPDFIVNVTNDAWYGKSHGPLQHFSMARFRAIEEGIPVIRSANTGVSGIIDPYGRIKARAALNTDAALTEHLPKALDAPTFYAKHKETLFFFIILLCGVYAVTARFLSKNKPTQ